MADPRQLKILHLEDNALDAELIDSALTQEGLEHTIRLVESKESFEAALSEDSFDIVISDYSLPGFNGFAALEILRKSHPHLPFLFVSGAIGEEEAVRGLREGATDYILKSNLAKIGPAVERAVKEMREREERQIAEKGKRDLQDQMEQMQRLEAIGRLAGGVAHDFNNALAAMSGYAEYIKNEVEPKSIASEFSGKIIQICVQTSKLTRQLLTFARKAKLEKQPLSVHEVIDQVADMLARTIDPGIEIAKDLQAEKAVVFGDSSQLANAFLNIGINARDAMPQGGKLAFSTGTVLLEESSLSKTGSSVSPGPYVEIKISDTGTGIAPQSLEHIFEPFYTTKEEGKGTGLGLASAYGCFAQHQGYLLVDSNVGKGSVFTIYLPVLEGDSSGIGSQMQDASLQGEARLMLVDDDDRFREAVSGMLDNLGYTVVACKDGEEAVEVYRQRHGEIDLVILDLVMPNMGGLDCYRALKKINKDVKVIVSSGYGETSVQQSILKEGALTLLAKPYLSSDIGKALAQALAK